MRIASLLIAASCALTHLRPLQATPPLATSPATATSESVIARTRHWTARELFEHGTARDVRLSGGGDYLELERGVLIEDDGPAAGYSYLPNEESLGGDVVVEKQLLVADPRADHATLLVGSTADFRFVVNGAPVQLESQGKAGNYWRRFNIPAERLIAGRNRFELSGTGKLWIALDRDYATGSETRRAHANRSRKSIDGGKTWIDRGLGTKGDLDGEYYVRLHLDQYRPAGVWWSPVVDLANLQEAPLSPAGDKRLAFQVRTRCEQAVDGQMRIAVRTGARLPFAPVDASGPAATRATERAKQSPQTAGVWAASHPEDSWEGWSDWQVAAAKSDSIHITAPLGRYAQVRIGWTTANPRYSPRVRGLELSVDDVAIEKQPTNQSANQPMSPLEPLPAWTKRLRFETRDVPVVRRSSIPFAYEPSDALSLAELRRAERLDDQVSGGQTGGDQAGGDLDGSIQAAATADKPEWQLITRLAAWSARRWVDGHLGQVYPPWNALEILKPHSDGKPVGGFCQQFNIVFLQACESFGLLGRAVSIGPGDHGVQIRSGHEVVEIWSNEFGKWVYIDGQAAWYFVDEHGVPLSLLELRERQLAVRDGKRPSPVRLVRVVETKWSWNGLDGWPAFTELRLIPRSDWLTRSAPLPLNQGMRGWFWSGHFAWTDDAYPASLLYGQRVCQSSNWNWTAQAAAARLQAGREPGELLVMVESVIPGGGNLKVRENDEPPRTTPSEFSWKLRPGVNRLVVQPVNRAGRAGVASRFTVNFDPPP
ncbi:MAG: hypothetical protein ACKO38_07670 [Planctomycetota bacterium]